MKLTLVWVKLKCKGLIRPICVFFSVSLLTACQHSNLKQQQQADRLKSEKVSIEPTLRALEKRYYDVDIVSFDGTRLRATVYQPALKAGMTAPVIIHSHSFSTFRMSRPLSMYGSMMFAGKTALKLWHQGYWVISFDQRGHGDSEGEIHLMSPDFEIKDASVVIDWAELHLPNVTRHADGSAIGMLGESYSGSMQLIASTQDPRIDAIVPMHSWYDLKHSLFPQGVAKGWLTTLILAGNILNYNRMDAVINNGYRYTRQKGGLSEAFLEVLEQRSLKRYCEQDQLPHADALLFQGFQDSLFGMDQGVQIRECFLRAGKDVRFIGTQHGHMLPLAQHDGATTVYKVDKTVHCGQHTYDTTQMVVDWFDEKLKRKSNAAGYIPPVCLTANSKQGLTIKDIPVGGQRFAFTPATVRGNQAGMFDWLLKPTRTLLHKMHVQPLANHDARLESAYIPLTTIQTAQYLIGIPLLRMTVTSPSSKPVPTLFIGLARQNRHSLELISEQVTPVHGAGLRQITLSGISTVLNAGDEIGIVIFSYHNQYRMARSAAGIHAQLQGEVELPLIDSQQNNPLQTATTSNRFKSWKDLPFAFQRDIYGRPQFAKH